MGMDQEIIFSPSVPHSCDEDFTSFNEMAADKEWHIDKIIVEPEQLPQSFAGSLQQARDEIQGNVDPRPKPKHQNWVISTSLVLSILVHGGLAAVCVAFGLGRYSSPQMEQSREATEGGLIEREADAAVAPALLPEEEPLEHLQPSAEDSMMQFRDASAPEIAGSDSTTPDAFANPAVATASEDDLSTPLVILQSSATPHFHRRVIPGEISKSSSDDPTPAAHAGRQASLKAEPSATTGNINHQYLPAQALGRAGGSGVGNGFSDNGMPKPLYPLEAQRRHEEGVVELDLEISPRGDVANVSVIRDPGYPRLVAAAVAAAHAAKFRPATRDGSPVSEHRRVPYRFKP